MNYVCSARIEAARKRESEGERVNFVQTIRKKLSRQNICTICHTGKDRTKWRRRKRKKKRRRRCRRPTTAKILLSNEKISTQWIWCEFRHVNYVKSTSRNGKIISIFRLYLMVRIVRCRIDSVLRVRANVCVYLCGISVSNLHRDRWISEKKKKYIKNKFP